MKSRKIVCAGAVDIMGESYSRVNCWLIGSHLQKCKEKLNSQAIMGNVFRLPITKVMLYKDDFSSALK